MEKHVIEQNIQEQCSLPMPPEDYAALLLPWYAEHRRPLPWRQHPTPYHVWISEIMLQQTRIEAVLAYYERFMQALPTVQALSAVNEDVLLKLWEGLGYYSRARNLQKAAKVVVEKWNGSLPSSYEDLLELPGIGEYTAGAIASISFGIAVPAVDGNVLRVLARLTACRADILQPKVKDMFRQLVFQMLPEDGAGAFNQGIMELGETVCLPNTRPLCEKCPFAGFCRAHETGMEMMYPIRTPKKPRTIDKRTIWVLLSTDEQDGKKRVLLHKRPGKGLLASLWELPNTQGWIDLEECGEAGLERKNKVAEVFPGNRLSLYGVDFPLHSLQKMPESKHIFTHIEWLMQGYCAQVPPMGAPEDCCWVTIQELAESYALPSAFRTYSRLLPILLETGKDENR